MLIGFDINWPDQVVNFCEDENIACKGHKLIYKLTENIKNLIDDFSDDNSDK